MKKYMRTCGHCARCSRCMFSHAGVLCRNYKPAGDDITIDKVFVDDAPATAPAEDRVNLVDCLGDTAPTAEPIPVSEILEDDNTFSLLSCWGNNTNTFYDPERSYNGGGYWQPSGGCLIAVGGRLVVVEYDKYDCGDFGCRRDYVVETPGFRWAWRESNLDGEGYDDTLSIYQSISGVLGVDADWFLDVARDAVQFAASATWDSRDDGEVPAV